MKEQISNDSHGSNMTDTDTRLNSDTNTVPDINVDKVKDKNKEEY